MKGTTGLVLINLGIMVLTGIALVATHSLWSILILLFMFSKLETKN